MFPARYARVLYALILAGIMSLMVTGITTFRAFGLTEDVLSRWIFGAWLPSWMVAFPAVLVVAPLTNRLVARLVRA